MTVKVPSKGTRGAFFPKFLTRLTHGMSLRGYRSGRMREVGGVPMLLLETRGAKSGQLRHAPLGYFEEGPGAWLIIGSTAGASWNPAWVHNLAADPDATIEFGDGRRVAVRAETVEGADLDAAWTLIAARSTQYSGYRSKTDRQIPVIRLRERAGDATPAAAG